MIRFRLHHTFRSFCIYYKMLSILLFILFFFIIIFHWLSLCVLVLRCIVHYRPISSAENAIYEQFVKALRVYHNSMHKNGIVRNGNGTEAEAISNRYILFCCCPVARLRTRDGFANRWTDFNSIAFYCVRVRSPRPNAKPRWRQINKRRWKRWNKIYILISNYYEQESEYKTPTRFINILATVCNSSVTGRDQHNTHTHAADSAVRSLSMAFRKIFFVCKNSYFMWRRKRNLISTGIAMNKQFI